MFNAYRAAFTSEFCYPQPCSVIHKKSMKTMLSNDFVAKSLIFLDHEITLVTRHFGGFQVDLLNVRKHNKNNRKQ